MKSPRRLARVIVLMLGTLLLVIGSRGFSVYATRLGRDTVAQRTPVPALTPQVFLPFVARKWPLILLFSDEFDGNELELTKWDVIKGSPTVGDGKLTLPGGVARDEIQSKTQFQYGVLQAVIESSDWKSQSQYTDSSFGFEIWTGAHGQCHYGVILIANGHLAVLRSRPDANNNCFGDPEYQAYLPISNWDVVRASGTVYLTLTWSPSSVALYVNDGGSNSGLACYTGEAEPTVPLKIRLNADTGETYLIDYIRVYQDS